ncbi:MAG: HAMP domain-containing protein [Novosphingobium sp.]|nr:HAMP domain-containing protein [Novosphingobium sp.]
MRLWPRSMTGQLMLAVALALLVVQGLGAFFVYRAEYERREADFVNAAAFRIAFAARGGTRRFDHDDDERRDRRSDRFRRFHLIRSDSSPAHADEDRDTFAEAMLKRILADREVEAEQVVIIHRWTRDDPPALARAVRRAAYFGKPVDMPEGSVMIAGVKLAGSPEWLVARVESPGHFNDLAGPLILQTLLIYLVLITVVALVMRRITRPLARLTNRVEQFARTRDTTGRIEPEGPDDVRRLIDAHNAMEARIASMLDEKDVMLGAIGHDLKTPLAALRVRIESVPDEGERAKMAGTIEDIVRSLDDILSLARVGRPSDSAERTELSALVASVVEEYEDMAKPVELGASERVVASLRPTWLRRALRNLIDNALRYGGTAQVSLVRNGDMVRLRVEDEGPGIPEADIGRMTDPFTRGDPSRNKGTGGAGLGLALARAIAEQHGGTLVLANRPEGGLRAEITLPV